MEENHWGKNQSTHHSETKNETIYFTDNESNGSGGLTSGEGAIRWDTGLTLISAGTVVTFTDVGDSSNLFSSLGTLTDGFGTLNLAQAGDAIFAFQGANDTTVTNFIAGIQNATDNFGDLTGTGLTPGLTANTFAASGHPDGGDYSGARLGSTNFSDYLALLGVPTNWTTNTSNGEAILPFDTTPFSISAIPEPTSPLLLGIVSLGAVMSYRSRRCLD